MKEIIVHVIPSCISWNREKQYIEEVRKAYLTKKSSEICVNKMKVIEETNDRVVIEYHR